MSRTAPSLRTPCPPQSAPGATCPGYVMVFDVSIVFIFVKASIPEVKKAANEKSAAKQGGYINGKKMLEVMFFNDLT